MRFVAGVLSVALFCCGLFVFAQAQQGQPVGPYPPCSAFGTAAGTCPNGGVITAGGPTGAATTVPVITYNAAGQLTAVTTAATGVTTVGTAVVGQVPGTTTNDNAAAGKVGEYVVSGVASIGNINTSATVTLTIANPGVVNWTGNPFFLSGATGNGCGALVTFATSGALPTGLTAGTPFYVTCDGSFTANAFHVSSSVANAVAGTAINFTGTQSGTQTGATVTNLAGAGTPIDIGGMPLTAGDWDVEIVGFYASNTTTSVTNYRNGITGSAASFATIYTFFLNSFAAEVPGGTSSYLTSPLGRISLPSTTTVFCDISSAFTVSTMSGGGFCRARRVR